MNYLKERGYKEVYAEFTSKTGIERSLNAYLKRMASKRLIHVSAFCLEDIVEEHCSRKQLILTNQRKFAQFVEQGG